MRLLSNNCFTFVTTIEMRWKYSHVAICRKNIILRVYVLPGHEITILIDLPKPYQQRSLWFTIADSVCTTHSLKKRGHQSFFCSFLRVWNSLGPILIDQLSSNHRTTLIEHLNKFGKFVCEGPRKPMVWGRTFGTFELWSTCEVQTCFQIIVNTFINTMGSWGFCTLPG